MAYSLPYQTFRRRVSLARYHLDFLVRWYSHSSSFSLTISAGLRGLSRPSSLSQGLATPYLRPYSFAHYVYTFN